jgi:5-methylcytosine-specific restriction protein B
MPYIYSWVPAYKIITKRIKDYSENHAELIKVLKQIGVEGFDDRDLGDQVIELNDIDPFTFISYLNKYGDDKRITILNNLCNLWEIDVKIHDVCGIPSTNAQKVWLFPYKFERNHNEIDRLWSLYHSITNNTVTEEQLNDIQTIRSVGWTKITEGLFALKPEEYLPLNSVVTPYLKSLGINVSNTSYTGIRQTCDSVSASIDKPFYQISYEGWLHAEELKHPPRYWRLGTKPGDHGPNLLPEMIANSVASIGWDNLGNIRNITPCNKTEIQKRLSIENYKGNNSTASRKAGEILNFINTVGLNDYIIAMDGTQVKAIGKVLHNRYIYIPELEFPNCRVVDWIHKDIKGLFFDEGLRTTLTEITRKSNIDNILKIMHPTPVSSSDIIENVISLYALNQILYGPPGTGKTYHTIDYAVKIATGKNLSDTSEHKDNKEAFDDLRKAGQIEFITFHQNYTYEDFIGGIRPDINSGNLRFDRTEGVFKQIADKARKNWENSRSSAEYNPDFDTVFQSFFSKLIEEEKGSEVVIPMSKDSHKFKITKVDFEGGKIPNFVKQSGGTSHDLLISNIKGLYNGTHSYSQDGLGIYYHPLVDQLKKHAKTLSKPSDKEELKNFVVIIDEINRANISRVFGELITLLEEDKRLGAENELRLTLPNKEEFALSPNLYVIGTMNTADKSIALLDIALRRRFEFVSFYPTHDVLDDLQSKELLTPSAVSLLKQINQKIYEKKKSADFLVGHAYFIRKQDSELATVLRKKVVPLLMEYFSGKTEEVSKIFEGSAFAVSYDTGNFDWSIN